MTVFVFSVFFLNVFCTIHYFFIVLMVAFLPRTRAGGVEGGGGKVHFAQSVLSNLLCLMGPESWGP